MKDFPYQASSQGRPLTGLIALFFDWLGINLIRNQQLFTLLSLIIYSVSITYLLEIIVILKKDMFIEFRIIAGITSIMIVLNFFSVDMFHYTVMMVPYSLSSFFTILAVKRMLIKQSYFNFFVAILFLILATFLYQSYITLFIPLVLFGFSFNSKSLLLIRDKVWWSCLTLVSYITALTIDYIYVKLHIQFLSYFWFDARTGQPAQVLFNLKHIYYVQKDLWVHSFGVFPDYLFLVFIFIFLFILILDQAKNKVVILSLIITILSLFYVALLIPHILSGQIGISVRSIMPFASIPALIIFVLLLHQKTFFVGITLKNVTLLFLIILFFLIQINVTHTFGAEGLEVNKLDAYYAHWIVDSISDYEHKSGNKVNILYFKNDSSPNFCNRKGCYIHAKALAIAWSRAESIKYYTNKEFNVEEMSEKDFQKKFDHGEWNEFVPQEQIKFEDNKAFIAVF